MNLCRSCGSSWRERLPDTQNTHTHYADYYARVPELSPLTAARLDAWARSLQTYRHTGRVLEVGCGAGHFLSAAEAAGFEAWGTEISSSGLSRLAGRRVRILDGELPKLGLPAAHFDAVVLFEVIEHLREPGTYLAEVRRVLREGGALLLTTPNFGSLSRRLLGNRWRIIDAEHLVLFTPQGLRRAISRAGLHLRSVSSRNIDPLEIIRALRSQPYGAHSARQARVDAIRAQIYGKTWLRAGIGAVNRVLNVLGLGDTLEARACR